MGGYESVYHPDRIMPDDLFSERGPAMMEEKLISPVNSDRYKSLFPRIFPRETFIIVVVISALTLFSLHRLSVEAFEHLSTPYDLLLESHNLATIKAIQSGKPIYDESFYGDLPFIITIYNPLYHLLTASLPQDEANPFFTGRLICLIATLFTLLLFLFPGYSENRLKLLPGSFLAMGWILLIPTFFVGTIYLHPNMLALLFSGIAIILIENPTSSLRIFLSSLFGLLAFATKQNFICATAASFLFLAFSNFRKAFLFAAVSVFLYGAFFVLVQKAWGDGYWFSAFISVSKHPNFLHLTLTRIWKLLKEPLFSLLVVCDLASIAYIAWRHKKLFNDSPYPIYLDLTAIVPLFALGKIGGEESYYVEFMFASLLCLVFFVRHFYQKFSRNFVLPFLLLFVIALGLQLSVAKPYDYFLTQAPWNRYFHNKASERFGEDIADIKPRNKNFLFINTHVMLPFSERIFFNDPYNYWLMWNSGILDPEPMIQAINNKFFSIIAYRSKYDPYEIPAMYPVPAGPAISRINEAIQAKYRLRKVGMFSYFVPIK